MAAIDARRLLKLCRTGTADDVDALLRATTKEEAAELVAHAEDRQGRTALMLAAGAGQGEVVSALLCRGAPWTALDNEGKCAGEHARDAGHENIATALLDAGVRSELVLGAALRGGANPAAAVGGTTAASGARAPGDAPYLAQKLSFTNTEILDENGDAVMAGWETPLMHLSADLVCAGPNSSESACGSILNIGFGMGLFDDAVQRNNPAQHTIIEAHPDVYQKMLKDGWGKKPNVRIVFGRWQDELPKLGKFDGIFFDTYSEDYEDMRELHAALPRHLNHQGVYSYFNGLAPNNAFFAEVYREVCRLELSSLGFDVFFQQVQVEVDRGSDGWRDVWKNVRRRYWHHNVYFAPVCIFAPEGESA